MQVGMTWPPWSGIGFQTASSQHSTWTRSNVDVVSLSYLKLFIFYWDWILLLIVSSSWNFYNKTNWAGVGESALKSVPSFRVPSLLFFPVYCSRLCSIHKWWDLVFIAENSLKRQIRMALVALREPCKQQFWLKMGFNAMATSFFYIYVNGY